MINDFFKLLFPEENAQTNFCNDLRDTTVYSVHCGRPTTERFSLNCLHPTKDLNPTARYHSSTRPRRCNANVIVHRNILIESDAISLDEQKKWLQGSNLPLSAIVFSGNKSLHIIISLEKAVSQKKYNKLVMSLYSALVLSGFPVDTSCKSASQLTRYPDSVRSDRGIQQSLLFLGTRIPNGALSTWINQRLPLIVKNNKKFKFSNNHDISTKVRAFIETGVLISDTRHRSILNASIHLYLRGYSISEIQDELTNICEQILPERNDLPRILNWIEKNLNRKESCNDF